MAAPCDKSEGGSKSQFSLTSKQNEDESKKSRLQGALFLGCVSGFFLMLGFGSALALAKRKDPRYFAKGMAPADDAHVTGARLALKALGIATVYSVGGFSLFCFGVAKFLGVSTPKEFHERMQEIIPRRPQPEPKGRTEFEGFRDLFAYLQHLDDKKKEILARHKD